MRKKHYLSLPWKKNIKKIPKDIFVKINKMSSKKMIIGCVKEITSNELKNGLYKHLKIYFNNGEIFSPKKIIPKAIVGKYSKINIFGEVVIRKDLPMITKTLTFDLPNYGDWSKGSHEVGIDREIYRRDFYPPRELAIEIELLNKFLDKEEDIKFIIKFIVDDIIHIEKKDYIDSLLFDINLLQENVGSFDIYKSDADINQYLKTIRVNWQILPPGEDENNLGIILSNYKSADEKTKKELIDRYKFLSKLNPSQYIAGTDGFRRYFGAQFKNDLVVFENIEYGNAIYVMYEKWEELSKLSRIDLLKMKDRKFDRIVHIKKWKKKLRSLLKKKLK